MFDPIADLPVLPDRNAVKVNDSENIDPIYKKPQKVESKHNIVSCNLHFRSFIPSIVDFYVDFARRASYELNIPCSGMVSLPTKTERWAVPKSPFVHKKRQEVFERKTHKRLLQLKDAHPEALNNLLEYLKTNAPPGVGIRADRYEYEDINKTLKDLEDKKVKLSDITPKPKILADAILEEMKKNPNANMYEVGLRLHKEIFNVELPSLDFTCKPKKKESAEAPAAVPTKGKGKKK
ncbi:ribosomal protein S10 [Neoconidiobolus thromboides FSU 785]|nr:ribosomal protein S10 [Neoconidiobolus thromboides FSU 785]